MADPVPSLQSISARTAAHTFSWTGIGDGSLIALPRGPRSHRLRIAGPVPRHISAPARTPLVLYYLLMHADSKTGRERLPVDQVALAVEVFRMLAEGTRIQILWALVDRELSVNEIAETIGKPGPSVSQHLAKLRMARLVRTRRDGNQVFYQVENDHVRQLVVDGINNAEHAGPSVPQHHVEQPGVTRLGGDRAHHGIVGPAGEDAGVNSGGSAS